jgi:hypothetical protein
MKIRETLPRELESWSSFLSLPGQLMGRFLKPGDHQMSGPRYCCTKICKAHAIAAKKALSPSSSSSSSINLPLFFQILHWCHMLFASSEYHGKFAVNANYAVAIIGFKPIPCEHSANRAYPAEWCWK